MKKKNHTPTEIIFSTFLFIDKLQSVKEDVKHAPNADLIGNVFVNDPFGIIKICTVYSTLTHLCGLILLFLETLTSRLKSKIAKLLSL